MDSLNLTGDALNALAKVTLRDRTIGCLFGSAIGDAVGLYTEFLSTEKAAQAYPTRSFILSPKISEATPFYRDRHRLKHQPGEWTDDTDHAMLILLGYLNAKGEEINPQELAARLRDWAQQGLRALDSLPLGLGRTVGSIVRTGNYLDDPEARARDYWIKSGYSAAPNGSLMRVHPLGLMCLPKTAEEAFDIAASFSVVTHVDPRCIISCVVGAALIRGLVLGEIRDETGVEDTINKALHWWKTNRAKQMEDESRSGEPDLDLDEFWKHARVNDLADLDLDEGSAIGYVYKCFGAGVHLLRIALRLSGTDTTSRNPQAIFESLITDLIMLGGDADTNACFAGSLLGSLLGYKSLPPQWRDGLKHGDWLFRKSESLCRILEFSNMPYDAGLDKDAARDGGRGFLTEMQMEERSMLLQARMAEEQTQWNKMEEQKEKEKGKSGRKVALNVIKRISGK